jgi:hypothetical protein
LARIYLPNKNIKTVEIVMDWGHFGELILPFAVERLAASSSVF